MVIDESGRRLLNFYEAAELLGLTHSTIYNWSKKIPNFPKVIYRGYQYIPVDRLEELKSIPKFNNRGRPRGSSHQVRRSTITSYLKDPQN